MKTTNDAEQVSCLMDGEPAFGQKVILDSLEHDEDLRARWQRYHLISDAMTKHLPTQIDCGFADRVRLAIDDEPTILSPGAFRKPSLSVARHVAGWSIAASVAIVALVGVQVMLKNDSVESYRMASAVSAAHMVATRGNTGVARVEYVESADDQELNQYLVNHNEYAGGMNGMLPYSRIVVSRSH